MKLYKKGNPVMKRMVCGYCEKPLKGNDGKDIWREFGAPVRLGEKQPRTPECKNCGGRTR